MIKALPRPRTPTFWPAAEQLKYRFLPLAIMPIMHIVLFKLKEGVSEDAIKAMNEAVKSMVRDQVSLDGCPS